MNDNADGANTGGQTREHVAVRVFAMNEQGEQPREQWYTVKQAAAQLGISERGVQQRVQRGKLRSKQDGNRLLVCFDSMPEPGEPGGEQNTNSEQLHEQNREHANEQQADGEQSYIQAAISRAQLLRELTEQQCEENAFLRAELTAQRITAEREQERHAAEIARRDVAEAEYRRLLLADRQEIARLQQQLAIAAAPVVTEVAPASVQTEAATPTPNTQHPTKPNTPAVSPEPRRPWWTWLTGKR